MCRESNLVRVHPGLVSGERVHGRAAAGGDGGGGGERDRRGGKGGGTGGRGPAHGSPSQ